MKFLQDSLLSPFHFVRALKLHLVWIFPLGRGKVFPLGIRRVSLTRGSFEQLVLIDKQRCIYRVTAQCFDTLWNGWDDLFNSHYLIQVFVIRTPTIY